MANEIEALIPHNCPHCGGGVVVKIKIVPPELVEVLKEEDVRDVIKTLSGEQDNHDTTQEPAAA